MARYGMLVDLRRCAGCGACVVACQMQNNQRPGISWNKLKCEEWGTEVGASGRVYIPHACMQCEAPACVVACPSGASQKREDGITVIDYEKCVSCGLCIPACPYSARVLNTSDENFFGASRPAPYEAHGVQRDYVVEKCIFCEARVAEGLSTACATNCPGKARYFGDLDNPESPIAQFLANNEATRIDETSFYYVPVKDMPLERLPFAQTDEGRAAEKAKPGIEPAVLGVGALGLVAAGAGAGYVVKKRKNSEGEDEKNEQ